MASKHSAQLSFCFKLAPIVTKPKLVKNAVHNFPVARNWPQMTQRNCRFAWNEPHLLKSLNLSKTSCATVLLLEIDTKTLSATVLLLQIGPYCYEAKACEKRRAQLFCCSKLAPNHAAQLSLCLKWATFVRKLKLVQNTVRNRAVARNWPQVRLRNFLFASNWAVLLRS